MIPVEYHPPVPDNMKEWRPQKNFMYSEDGIKKYSTEPRPRKLSNGGIPNVESYGSRPTQLSRTNGDSFPQKESDAYAAAYDNGGDVSSSSS